MKTRTLLLGAILFSLVIAFVLNTMPRTNLTEKVADFKIYSKYLKVEKIKTSTQVLKQEAQLDFWKQKLKTSPQSSLYKLKVARILSERFKTNGVIADLKDSDKLLQEALQGSLLKKSPYYLSLCQNAISQHEFQKALAYADKALETGEANQASQYMRFDVLMEIGNVTEAKTILSEIKYKDQGDFDFLIRKSKLQDAEGDLEGAIYTLEEAKKWVIQMKDSSLYCWIVSNLADYYGHAGNVQKAYDYYLKVLETDVSYLYALKGIAWVELSNDGDYLAAENIIDYLQVVRPSPDLLLLKAEIASIKGLEEEAKKIEENFITEVSKEKYGRMYDSYLADLFLEREERMDYAFQLAHAEIKNRPNAAAYLLLARYYQKIGKEEEAFALINEKVAGKTEEPDVLFHVGVLCMQIDNHCTGTKYLEEASEAKFELGPIKSKIIQEQLQKG